MSSAAERLCVTGRALWLFTPATTKLINGNVSTIGAHESPVQCTRCWAAFFAGHPPMKKEPSGSMPFFLVALPIFETSALSDKSVDHFLLAHNLSFRRPNGWLYLHGGLCHEIKPTNDYDNEAAPISAGVAVSACKPLLARISDGETPLPAQRRLPCQ